MGPPKHDKNNDFFLFCPRWTIVEDNGLLPTYFKQNRVDKQTNRISVKYRYGPSVSNYQIFEGI